MTREPAIVGTSGRQKLYPVVVDEEIAIEERLRRRPWVVPAASLAVAVVLAAGLGACLAAYRVGHVEIVVISGLLAHAWMILLVHDGAHRALTRGTADRWICSLAAGALIMPLYGEAFRKYHLLHHKYTNEQGDPLFSPAKRRLYERSRLLYMALDVVPMLLTFVCPAEPAPASAPRIRLPYLAAGLAASAAVIYWARPELGFVVGSIVTLYAWATVRDWCEHFGRGDGFANTYRFPLGLGIGNHAAHHQHPGLSWLAMAIGLRRRRKDARVVRAAWAILRDRDFEHYRAPGP
jgi:fatty acid desaturase